jgi:hypothetical protein
LNEVLKITQQTAWSRELGSDFDIHVAHVEQMVHIRPPRIHLWHLSVCPKVATRIASRLRSPCQMSVAGR